MQKYIHIIPLILIAAFGIYCWWLIDGRANRTEAYAKACAEQTK